SSPDREATTGHSRAFSLFLSTPSPVRRVRIEAFAGLREGKPEFGVVSRLRVRAWTNLAGLYELSSGTSRPPSRSGERRVESVAQRRCLARPAATPGRCKHVGEAVSGGLR